MKEQKKEKTVGQYLLEQAKRIEAMSSEEFDEWWEKNKVTDEEAKPYAKLERFLLGDNED